MPEDLANARWTKLRTDGRPHFMDPVECFHCSHKFSHFDMVAIVLHCREAHRAFYKRKWDTELENLGSVGSEFYPLPEDEVET